MTQYKPHILAGCISLLTYVMNRLYIKPHITNDTLIAEIAKNHLNDFLASILLCAYINVLLLRNCNSCLNSFRQYFLVGVLCSISWEVLAPRLMSSSTGDILDCVAYMLGCLLYYMGSKLLND